MLKAVTRQATLVDTKIKELNAAAGPDGKQVSTAYFFDHYATKEDISVMVTEQDFLDAHKELIPSVSAGELEHYEQVRAMFEGAKDKKKDGQGAGEANGVNGHQNGNGTLAITMGDGDDAGSNGSKKDRKGKGKAVDNEVNGGGKGKGKEVVSPFQEAGGDEDEGLYD